MFTSILLFVFLNELILRTIPGKGKTFFRTSVRYDGAALLHCQSQLLFVIHNEECKGWGNLRAQCKYI